MVVVKKKTNMVSIIATRDSQTNPGIMPNSMVAIMEAFCPYILLVNLKTIINERTANITDTSLAVNTFVPIIPNRVAVVKSNTGG